MPDRPAVPAPPDQLQRRPLAGILLFDEVEVLDFAGPYEVFSGTRGPDGATYLDVATIGPVAGAVTARGGLQVQPTYDLDSCPGLDALIVPGGPGADDPSELQRLRLLPFIRDRAGSTPIVASVCTGAFLLGRAGLLDGRSATTHTAALARLRSEFPAASVVEAKVVDEGAILTAAGVSSGIDLALHLLQRWFGPEARARAAANLDGPWA